MKKQTTQTKQTMSQSLDSLRELTPEELKTVVGASIEPLNPLHRA